MTGIRWWALLALGGALAGCTSSDPAPSPTSVPPSARAGLGGPSPSVSEVADEVVFRMPSKNIFCAMHPSTARCDIIHKTWTPPAKPATCELDWGNGLYISSGQAAVTCTGDSLIGAATTTLDYGRAYRSGDVLCESQSAGVTCQDEKTGRGFTLAAARYSIF
jgi:hypothetical protein